MATTKAKTKKAITINEAEEDKLPSELEAKEIGNSLLSLVNKPYLFPYITRLKQLKNNPPQVILFEGANKEVRLALASYWACIINCSAKEFPCGECATCLSIMCRFSKDYNVFDGLAESIKVEDMREKVVKIISQAPSDLDKRVFLFYEANSFSQEAANTLLKSFEEPNKTSHFILTIPQKDLLLPTIVSRSLIFSLPLEICIDENDTHLTNMLASFLIHGTGIFDEYTSKKEFGRKEAKHLLHILMLAINTSYSKNTDIEINKELIQYLSTNMSEEALLTITNFIFKSLEMIENSNSPNCTLIIESLLVQVHMILKS